MGVVTGNHTFNPAKSIRQPGGQEIIHDHKHPENKIGAASQNDSAQSHDYLPLVARATHDALRDWNLINGQLSWPHGLETMFGYKDSGLDGDIQFWEERLHPLDKGRTLASIHEALTGTAERWSGEYRFRCANGRYLQILERAVVIRDDDGKAQRLVGSLMDLTPRKQFQDQLARSQKMEAFGQLAGGVAHDFNNFLTTILGYSDLVLCESQTKAEISNHVAEIRKAADRASNLAGQLLAFSRKGALEPHVVEVNNVILNLERSLLRLLGDNITVVCNLHRDKQGAHIKVDPGQLTQIILNLGVNARDAMPAGGRLTLETTTTFLREAQLVFGEEILAPGDYVVIRIIDSGTGMTEEIKAHLFEPFFTTKDVGTGLGLAASYGIVRQSGGHILVESELGHGTTMNIYLPRVPAPPPPAYKRPILKKLPAGTETILVLEDDISVRHISVRILRNLGYEVIEAANVDDAQRLFGKADQKDIHLLLTDLVMPQMSGRGFADWLAKVSPETKVVFVSGYLTESLHPGDRIEHGMFFLPKPFDPEQLAQTVRRALDCPK